MDKIRAEFETRRDKEMMSRYRWCDDEKIYKPEDGDAFSDGGKYWKAEQLTIALYSFAEGYESAKASQWISVADAILNEESTYWVCDWSGDVFTAKYWDGDHPFFGGTDGEFYASLSNVTHVMQLEAPEAPE